MKLKNNFNCVHLYSGFSIYVETKDWIELLRAKKFYRRHRIRLQTRRALSSLVGVKVIYQDGGSYITTVNGTVTDDEIRNYFINKVFTEELGFREIKRRCVGVEIDRA